MCSSGGQPDFIAARPTRMGEAMDYMWPFMSVCLRDGKGLARSLTRPMTLYFNFMPEAFLFEGFIAETSSPMRELSFETKNCFHRIAERRDKLKLNNITPLISAVVTTRWNLFQSRRRTKTFFTACGVCGLQTGRCTIVIAPWT
jgi:hypothetical protein